MDPKRVVVLFIVVMVVAAVAIGVAVTELTSAKKGSVRAAQVNVVIRNFAFVPENITIAVNTTVSWTNNDTVAHTATSLSGAPAAFDSGTLNPGSVFTFKFTVLGTYPYYCAIHTFMRGNVTVVGSGNTTSVKIIDYSFQAADITVKMGTTVTWTNDGTVTHTVTAKTTAPVVFDSGNLSPGATYTYTFTQVGVYPYYCKIHPFMLGNVTVTA